LIETVPVVYMGPDGLVALGGGKGLLLGSKRPDWIDVVGFERRSEERIGGLIHLRLDWKSEHYDVVGIVLSKAELKKHRSKLIRELVPGDVLLVPEETKTHKNRVYVHLGDELAAARLKLSRSTSARSRLPRRSRRS
jgi:hypothetical protein